jgi:hypothetical protein
VSRGKFHKTFVCVKAATPHVHKLSSLYLNYCERKRETLAAIWPRSIQQTVRAAIRLNIYVRVSSICTLILKSITFYALCAVTLVEKEQVLQILSRIEPDN